MHVDNNFAKGLAQLPDTDIHQAISSRIFARCLNLFDWQEVLSRDFQNDQQLLEKCKSSTFYGLVSHLFDSFAANGQVLGEEYSGFAVPLNLTFLWNAEIDFDFFLEEDLKGDSVRDLVLKLLEKCLHEKDIEVSSFDGGIEDEDFG